MRSVAMVRLSFFEIFQPFLYLAVFADLYWRQLCSRGKQSIAEFGVCIKDGCRLNTRREQPIHQLAVTGRSHRNAAAVTIWRKKDIFRRNRWAGDQPVILRVRDHVVEKKLSRALQNGIGPFFQKCTITSEQVVFPKM